MHTQSCITQRRPLMNKPQCNLHARISIAMLNLSWYGVYSSGSSVSPAPNRLDDSGRLLTDRLSESGCTCSAPFLFIHHSARTFRTAPATDTSSSGHSCRQREPRDRRARFLGARGPRMSQHWRFYGHQPQRSPPHPYFRRRTPGAHGPKTH